MQISTIIAGDDRIDMRSAPETMNAQLCVNGVRVDSGGDPEQCAPELRAC